MLCLICGSAAGCAAASATENAPVHATVKRAESKRFCAYEISPPDAAQAARISRYWTPLARSALRDVSHGKMVVTVPKARLSPGQRRALRLAERADRAFAPRPKLICRQLPDAGGRRAPA
jgi:hypothetical protein